MVSLHDYRKYIELIRSTVSKSFNSINRLHIDFKVNTRYIHSIIYNITYHKVMYYHETSYICLGDAIHEIPKLKSYINKTQPDIKLIGKDKLVNKCDFQSFFIIENLQKILEVHDICLLFKTVLNFECIKRYKLFDNKLHQLNYTEYIFDRCDEISECLNFRIMEDMELLSNNVSSFELGINYYDRIINIDNKDIKRIIVSYLI